MCLHLDIISLERGNPLVVSGSAHYRCDFLIEVICDCLILFTVELNNFVLVYYAGDRLNIARGGSSEELHESTLMSSTDHFMDRKLSLRYLSASISLDFFS